jgi:hypothetical protein
MRTLLKVTAGVVGLGLAIGACGITKSPTEPTECTVAITPVNQAFTDEGGAGTVTVTAPSECTWSATASAEWIALTAGRTGVGPGAVTYSVAANAAEEPRSGTITIEDQRHAITQSGRSPIACSYAISPEGLTFSDQGGAGTVTVTTAAGCSWSATSSAAWTVITAGQAGTGPGTVAYTVAGNPDAGSRSGTLTIADQRHTIVQNGRSPVVCRYELVPPGVELGSNAAEGTFAVRAPDGCEWSAASAASWLVVRSGGGSGNGDVNYSVTRNPGVDARSATIAVADRGFTVRQAGDLGLCQYSVTPVEFRPCMAGGSLTASLTTDASCPWTVTSSATWLSLPGTSGTGPGILRITFSDNYDPPREGIVQVRWPTPTAGQNIRVMQAGCYYAVSRDTFTVAASGGTGTFVVIQQSDPNTCGGATQDRCVWTARADVGWITVTTSMPRAGDDRVAFSIAANDTPGSRVGRITVRDKVVIVTQAGR